MSIGRIWIDDDNTVYVFDQDGEPMDAYTGDWDLLRSVIELTKPDHVPIERGRDQWEFGGSRA